MKRVHILLILAILFRGVLLSAEVEEEIANSDVLENLLNHRMYKKAINYIHSGKAKDLSSPEKHLLLGTIYRTIEEYAPAFRHLKKALRSSPTRQRAQIGIWNLQLEKGWPDTTANKNVKKSIKKVLKRHKNRFENLQTAYAGYQALEAWKETDSIWEKIRNDFPDEIPASFIAADRFRAILQCKDSSERITAIKEFLDVFGQDDSHYELLMQYLMEDYAFGIKDKIQAIRQGEKWLKELPKSPKAHLHYGKLLVWLGINIEKSIAVLQNGINLFEKDPDAGRPKNTDDESWMFIKNRWKGEILTTLSEAFFFKRNTINAAKYIQQAEKLGADTPHHHLVKARILRSLGKNEEARAEYALSFTNPSIRKHLNKELLNMLGKNQKGVSDDNLIKMLKSKISNIQFSDATEELGLKNINCSKISWADINGDGFQDLIAGGQRFFINENGTNFREVTKNVCQEKLSGNASVWADADNDGDLDGWIIVDNPYDYDRFLRNRGDGSFDDSTETITEVRDIFPTQAGIWADFDNNGFVDLYLANYEKKGLPTSGTKDRLLMSMNGKKLMERSNDVKGTSLEPMCGRSVAASDYDEDGDIDIFVGNYRLDPDFMLNNNGKGCFTDAAFETCTQGRNKQGYYGHTIGAEWSDYNNDGKIDLFRASLAHPRAFQYSDLSGLLQNNGKDKTFTDNRINSGISYRETHYEPTWADLDNDGDTDLLLTCCYPSKEVLLYRNDNGTFFDITWASGILLENGRGAAAADYDRDGDMDLAICAGKGLTLLQNKSKSSNWLIIKLEGTVSNRSGIGARIEIEPDGPVREVYAGKGSGSQSALPVHLGLGDSMGPVNVKISWPSGKKELYSLELNREYSIREGTGQADMWNNN
ncbi:MAG: FG-GAP-like repeat-containing protein [Candidatus Theseobacter exili]|nr:FG-GAP-like repeat-containing protein [Candidatus Theseobacter exili]